MNSFWTQRSTLIIAAIYLALALVATAFAERALDALVGTSAGLGRLGAFRAFLLVALAFPFAVFLLARRLRRPTEATTPLRKAPSRSASRDRCRLSDSRPASLACWARASSRRLASPSATARARPASTRAAWAVLLVPSASVFSVS